MPSYNKVLLMGHLTRNPEMKQTQGGTHFCKFGLAMNRKYKRGDDLVDEKTFAEVTVWGKQAESCEQYLEKGAPVFIEGRLQFHQWETDDGHKRNKLEVTATMVQFLAKSGNYDQDEIAF